MSYPYEQNPWDEPTTNNNASQNQPSPYAASTTPTTAPTISYGGDYSASGYSNPLSQYPDASSSEQATAYNYDYQADPFADQSAYSQPTNYGQDADLSPSDQQGQQNYQQQEQQQQQQQKPSWFRGFVSSRAPFCLPVLDCLCAISLPLLDRLAQKINKDLLVSKMFYFFFYSAFGSLFPLMGVYFKQAGMNPAQVGILTGIRPLIEIFSAPFWHSLADRFHKSKALLIFSLCSWIIFTCSLAPIRPPASACIAFNDTDYVLYVPYSSNDLSNFIDVQSYSSGTIAPPALDANGTGTGENESYINRPPLGQLPSTNSEVPSAEGARRRRRRSVGVDSTTPKQQLAGSYPLRPDPQPQMAGYVYKLDADNNNGDNLLVPADSFELDVDFENDFVDQAEHRRRYRRMATQQPSGDDQESDDQEGEGTEVDKNNVEEPADEESTANNKKKPQRQQQEGDAAVVDTKKSQEGDEQEGSTTGNSVTTEVITTPATTTSKKVFKNRHKTPPTHIVGMSPITVEYAVNYNKEKHSQLVTPMFSTIVYKLEDIKSVFFLLLLLISLGEFFSAPALTLADSATLRYLGADTDSYGRQRMFGSLSWAITLLLVGMALDNSTSIADHPCGPHIRERSYTVCFIIFSLLMGLALLTASQFRFDYPAQGNVMDASGQYQAPQAAAIVSTTVQGDSKIITTATGATANIDDFYETSTQPRSIFNTAPPVNMPPPGHQGREKFEFLDKWKSAVFAQSTWELPEWVNVFRQFFRNPLHLTYLFITWFLGCGVGLVFTFLFWHLQDVGGTPTIFGICSVINHISEIFAYFFSFSIIKRFGHTKVSSCVMAVVFGALCRSFRTVIILLFGGN